MWISIAIVAAVAVPTGAHIHDHHHHHPPMSPSMQQSMHLVEQSCSRDVALFCSEPDEVLSKAAPIMRTATQSPDPFVEFLTNPMAPPPMMLDVSQMLDDMMKTALVMSQQPDIVFVSIMEPLPEPPQKPQPEAEHEQKPKEITAEQAFDSMFSTLAERVASSHGQENSPAMDPIALSKRIVEHGKELLDNGEPDDDRVRMARRLTEVRPQMFQGPNHPHLPFGCPKNRCLTRAFQDGRVSMGCADALRGAERLHQKEVTRHALQVQHESQAFLSFGFLYVLLAVATVYMLHRRYNKFRQTMREQKHLKRRILQAVYSNPRIKETIESELQEEIGFVPPLPFHVLSQMGGPKFPHRGFMACKCFKLIAIIGLFVLAFGNPLLAMPLLCLLMMLRCCQLTCCPSEPPVRKCTCCCCGVDTEKAAKGEVSETEACCTCCKGTGVCAPGCAACCGDDPCDCCHDGCDCCDGSSPGKGKKHVAKEGIYMGVPVQVV